MKLTNKGEQSLFYQIFQAKLFLSVKCTSIQGYLLSASDIKTCTGISLGDRPLVYTVR